MRRSSTATWAGVSSTGMDGMFSRREGERRPSKLLGDGVIGLDVSVLQRVEDGAEGGDQLVARDIALAKLNAQAEGLVFGLKIEDKGLRAGPGGLLFAAGSASFVAGETAFDDAVHGFGHF